jgi:hypothetical protein
VEAETFAVAIVRSISSARARRAWVPIRMPAGSVTASVSSARIAPAVRQNRR